MWGSGDRKGPGLEVVEPALLNSPCHHVCWGLHSVPIPLRRVGRKRTTPLWWSERQESWGSNPSPATS